MDNTLANLVLITRQVGTLPEVYEKVNRLVSDPSTSAIDLAKALATDPVISKKLLRLVNSAMYGMPNSVDTVVRALSIVGFSQVRDLVLGTAVIAQFANSPASKFIRLEEFWRHSVAVGVAARALALIKRHPNAEAVFTGGLMHDLGRLVMLEAHEKIPMSELLAEAQRSSMPLHRVERQLFSYTHADVAEGLFRNWNLPPNLREMVAFHHSPGMAQRFREEAAIIHVADLLVHAIGIGDSGDSLVPQIDEGAWATLGLDPAQLELVAQRCEAQTPELMHIFAL